jgi:hypothetical protein
MLSSPSLIYGTDVAEQAYITSPPAVIVKASAPPTLKADTNYTNMTQEHVAVKIISMKGKVGKASLRFRVRWQGYSSDDDTWEPIHNIRKCQAFKDYAKTRSHLHRLIQNTDNGRSHAAAATVGTPLSSKRANIETQLAGTLSQDNTGMLCRCCWKYRQ